jgi:sec-independent protein translocase protein TatB
MFNIGAGELIFILVVALLILGPQRLPEFARGIGRFLREFRRQTDDVRTMVEREFYRMDQEVLDERLPPPPPPIPAGKVASLPVPPLSQAGASSSPVPAEPVPAELATAAEATSSGPVAPEASAGSPHSPPSGEPAQAEELPRPAPPLGTVPRGSAQGG